MKKTNIMDNQHDHTKKLLGIIRESKIINKGKKIITEQITKDLSDEDIESYSEEEKNFRSNVSPRVKFNRFKLYPEAQNVEFSGEFTDSRIEWFYSLDDSRGVYMTADILQLNDSTLKQIQKLVAYYDTWSEEWANKIAEEYKDRELENEIGGEEEISTIEDEEEEFF
jgi:hypothetical protein